MNSNRALMKQSLNEHGQEIKKLNTRASLLLRELAVVLNPALQEFVEMDIAQASGHMDDLVMIQAELLGHQTKIAQLEEALYG